MEAQSHLCCTYNCFRCVTGNREVNVPISDQTTSSSQSPGHMLVGSSVRSSDGARPMPDETSTMPSNDTPSLTVPAVSPRDKEDDIAETSDSKYWS